MNFCLIRMDTMKFYVSFWLLILGFSTIVSEPDSSFDFIIVGGGTSGCAVARRLTENGKYSVLVLEAGGYPLEDQSIPGLAKVFETDPNVTFQYESVPQRRAALGNNGIVHVPVGKVLGGTSTINYNFFNRGSPYDYDNWGNLTQDASWKYSNMLKYLKRSETYRGEFPSDQHGFSGPIIVGFQQYAPARVPWINGGRELGFQIKDPNGPQQISFGPVEFSRRFGRRVSSFTGYIQDILNDRKNLRIVTNALVSKIIFNGKRAVGVHYTVNGRRIPSIAFANKEIILSAGTYGSSTLLMRSGIGPRDLLQKAGIPLVKALPVGENLQEHPVVPLQFILNNRSLVLDRERDQTAKNYKLFLRRGIGPYTSVAGYSGQAFIASSLAINEGHPEWADIQLVLSAVNAPMEPFKNVRLEPSETTILVFINLAREKSRGTVKLNPNNINGMPLIDFNYLEDPRDEQVFLEGINITMNLLERTEAFKSVGARYLQTPIPACSKLVFRSEAYWRCYMRQTIIGGNHPTSTCSMNSVVDSSLRVIGMTGLRVVDASVMPTITNSNLQAAIYGIAEKISQDILNDWQ